MQAHWHAFITQDPLQHAWLPIGPGGHAAPAAWHGAQTFAGITHQSPEQHVLGGIQA